MVALTLAYGLFLAVYRLAEAVFGVAFLSGRLPTIANWLALTATFEPLLVLPLLPLLGLMLMWRVYGVALVLGVASLPFVFFYTPLFLPQTPPTPSGPTLTVLTHNILAANQDTRRLGEAILAEQADVVALQELVANHANRLAPQLGPIYPHRVIYSAQGLGVYSRYPLRDAQLLTLAPEMSYAVRATLDAPSGPLTIFNAHPRNPRIEWNTYGRSLLYVANFDPSRRDRAVAALTEAVERTSGPVIVLGDLNLPDRSVAYRQLTRRLRDAHREVGWGLGFTFPDTRPQGRATFLFPILRIDYVLYSSELTALESRVGPASGSDHRPVIARLGVRRD